MGAADTIRRSYDERYKDAQPNRVRLRSDRWPRNRKEASLYFAKGGNRVLDVGCGSGVILYNLRDKYRQLCGIELSGERLGTTALTLEGLDTDLRTGNLEEGLDFPDAHFDTLIVAAVIEHFVDVWSATEEMARLLKPGGQVIVSTPNIAYALRRLTLLAGRFPSTSAGDEGFATKTPHELLDGGHFHYFTYRMMRKLFEKYGFSRIDTYGIGRLGRIHDLRPPLTSAVCVAVATK